LVENTIRSMWSYFTIKNLEKIILNTVSIIKKICSFEDDFKDEQTKDHPIKMDRSMYKRLALFFHLQAPVCPFQAGFNSYQSISHNSYVRFI